MRVWTVEEPGIAKYHGPLVSYRRPWRYTSKKVLIPVLDYPVRKVALKGPACAVADYKNAVVDGCRAVGTGVYAARIHLQRCHCHHVQVKRSLTIELHYPTCCFHYERKPLKSI